MFRKMLEFYNDELVVKTKEEETDFKYLQRVFERCRQSDSESTRWQLESQPASSLAVWSIGMEWTLTPPKS